MDPGRNPARGASIRLVPPQDDDPFVEPSKYHGGRAASSNGFLAPDPGLIASQAGHQSFRFGFASPVAHSPPSPAVGESALSPPEPSKSRFSSSTVCSPEHARVSSFAVPGHPPGEPSRPPSSTSTSNPEMPGLLFPPTTANTSRFSRNTSSNSDSPPTSSPPAEPMFSPTFDGGYSPKTLLDPPAMRSRFSSTTVESPPPIRVSGDRPDSASRGPLSPSQWQSFFSPTRPQFNSRFSASTTSPPEANPPSPPSTGDSTSSSSSFDGTSASVLPDIPNAVFYNQPNRRIYTSSSARYSHAFPTTDLSVIDEDEAYAYPSSPPLPPPIPLRSPTRPITADRETQTSDATDYSAPLSYPAGAAAAVSIAAGALRPPQQAHPRTLPGLPSTSSSYYGRRVSAAPQLPPLPPFNHSTDSLQRYFSYFTVPNASSSPVIGTYGQARSPNASVVTFSSVTGPHGERFSALREKRQSRGVYWADGTRKRRWAGIRGMTWKMWFATIVIGFVIMAILAIGLGIGLTRNDGGGDDNNSQSGAAGGNDGTGAGEGDVDNPTASFPAGVFSITTNLFNLSSACTNVSETWECAPGSTVQQGGLNASQFGLVWTVSQNNVTDEARGDDGFSISSVTNPFSLQFDNTPLTLREEGSENEHWGFQVQANKRVRPQNDLTGTNVAVECDYRRAELTGRLFTRRQPDPAFADSGGSWPGAVEVVESSEIEGECFEIRNGVRGARVDVGVGPSTCSCIYGDSEPG